MEVKRISEKIFGTISKKEEKNSSQTNPFGVVFNGKIINADVFETKKTCTENIIPSLAKKAANKGKMWVSTMVGSINDFNEVMAKRINSVMDFGNRIKENTAKLNQYLNDTKTEFINKTSKHFSKIGLLKDNYSVENLMKLDTEEIASLFEQALAKKALDTGR